MSDSSDVDNALIAKLGADAVLLSLMPNGVYWDEAPEGSTQFVIVSLVEDHDTPMFGARAFENPLYLVKAVEFSTVTTKNSKAAAARIDALLDPQPPLPRATLIVPGYGVMNIQRESRLRITEVDAVDASKRWQHRGGRYQLLVAPTMTV